MDELLDLGILKTSLSELIAHSNIDDCVLPNEFKAKFNAFGDYKIEHYNLYTLQVSSKKSLLVTFIGAGIGDVATFEENERWHLAPNVAKMEPFIGCENLLSVKFINYFMM